ncbi:E3 ubiquitin-protein ligase Praja-1-like isoform X1 [Hydractinia symbiolongicarpus]|uniref:E3 ubiquitin-protein ligase Praja-1-like isoform X1 n=1 Tax=Hydractinia symbiolongicarpus TaxID=13093 RepID=UPI0025513D36|nr:E3 ubiquitin-protein ligase Praja-1-like isoform X1 [Hydractinia symbiolongicarpus]
MDDSFEIPNLVSDSDSDHRGSSGHSMPEFSSESEGEEGEFNMSHHLQNPSFLSNNAMMSEEVQNTGDNVFQQLPQQSGTDDEDDSGWSTVDDSSTDASDTSDFDDSFSVPSEDSSVADDDEFSVFEMLSHHFEMFSNSAPSFFGVSLQMLYDRIMDSLQEEEEKDSPTPQHILESLPSVKVTIAQVASSLSCCICFGEYVLNEQLLQLPCTHFYHNACILNWLKIKSTCPTCRLDLATEKFSNHTEASTNSPANNQHDSAGSLNFQNIQGNFNTELLTRTISSSTSGTTNGTEDPTSNRNNVVHETSLLCENELENLQSFAGSSSRAGTSETSEQKVHTPSGRRKNNTSKEPKRLSRETEIW